MKITETRKYVELREKYNNLVDAVQKYILDVHKTKLKVAYRYKVSEQPKELTVNAPPQQFNVIEVRSLLDHVQTAEQLGYMTLLKAEGTDGLLVTFLQRQPEIPFDFFSCRRIETK